MAKGKYEKWLKEENLLLLEGWARDGLTDEQIAKNIGITVSTFYEWKKKYSEISESLKRAKMLWTMKLKMRCYPLLLGATQRHKYFG